VAYEQTVKPKSEQLPTLQSVLKLLISNKLVGVIAMELTKLP